MGLLRNLEAGEIVEQFLQLEKKEPISNIVFMGMGEPLLNYENLKKQSKFYPTKTEEQWVEEE